MRNIKKIAGRLLLIFLVLFLFETVVEFLYRSCNQYSLYAIRELKESQGKIDTLFLGTSTTYRGLSPQVFDEEMGTYSFNAATASQPISGTLQLIKDQVKRNPIKQVIIGISPNSLKESDSSMEAKALVYDRIFSPTGKLSYLINGCTSEDWLYLNFYSVRVEKYLNVQTIKENVAYKLSDAYKENQSPIPGYQGRGFLMKEKVYSGKSYEVIEKKEGTWKADAQREKELIEIMEYCREKEIQLTLVFIPVSGREIKLYKDISVIHDYLSKLAAEHETVFWDFNYYAGVKEEFSNTMFQDKKHLNGAGGMYFSQLFAKIYKEYQNGAAVDDYFSEECPYYENID